MNALAEARSEFERGQAAVAHFDFPAAVKYFTSALESLSAAESPEPTLRSALLKARGHAYLRLRETSAALRDFEILRTSAPDERTFIDGCIGVANACDSLARYAEALGVWEEALRRAEKYGYSEAVPLIYRGRAMILWKQGQSNLALEALQVGLDLCRARGDLRGENLMLTGMAISHALKWRLAQAIELSQTALALAETRHDEERVCIELNNLGQYYQMLYQAAIALGYHERGLAMAPRVHVGLPEIDLLRNTGVDCLMLARPGRAFELLQRALALARGSGERDMEMQVWRSLGEGYLANGRPAAAREAGEALIAIARKLSAPDALLAWGLLILGRVQLVEKRYATAEETLREALDVASHAWGRVPTWHLHAALGELYAGRNEALASTHFRLAGELIYDIALAVPDKNLRAGYLAASEVDAVLQRAERYGFQRPRQ